MMYVTSKSIQICRYSFTSKNRDSDIEKLNIGIGWDIVHSNHTKFSGKLFRSFIRRLFNRFIPHGYVPQQMLSGEFRPIVKK